MLCLDVENTREGTDFKMYMMWYVITMASLLYLTVILPFGLFYSETDEERDFVSCLFETIFHMTNNNISFVIEMAGMLGLQEWSDPLCLTLHLGFPFLRPNELLIFPYHSPQMLSIKRFPTGQPGFGSRLYLTVLNVWHNYGSPSQLSDLHNDPYDVLRLVAHVHLPTYRHASYPLWANWWMDQKASTLVNSRFQLLEGRPRLENQNYAPARQGAS